MFDILLPDNEAGPLYMQLYRTIRDYIQCGAVADGTKLPSVRSLSVTLHISKTPIEAAYHLLMEEGYAVSKPRSGLFVVTPASAHAPSFAGHEPTIPLANKMSVQHQLPPRQDQEMIDFNLLSVDTESLPIRSWKSVWMDAMSMHGNSLHQYGDSQGEYGLRASLVHYLKTSRGVSCIPEQIIIGTGISNSIRILSHLLGSAKVIAFEEGGIAQVRNIFAQNEFVIRDVPLASPETIVDALDQSNVHGVYLTPSHQPNGTPLLYSKRMQLLQWAYDHERYIIEDDYDGEFRHAGKTIPSLQGLDYKGVVIYLGTFSKAFTPALRMNYMVLPLPLAQKLKSSQHLLTCPSRIDQLAMQLFIDRGHWFQQIRRMRILYRKKRSLLVELIQQHLSPYVEVNPNSAALHLEVTVLTSCPAEELQALAEQAGVIVYISQSIRYDISPRIYLGFAGMRIKEMKQGILLLKQAWFGQPEPASS
ncbi:PLP-dependent aminotransferase family protein [Paenibacillus alba]|uniref:MocR-like pyridoxine biosynthesis transcription factor PdxR n=1 Tax=Paenibacillus alba TaxID=1197127 RepID=UPI001565A0DB|nr:PLP-dependent aminotransferase family protein [Paenibacillus alba]NQX67666.1 PLP-dependent aminotransferase family protein [Paenibacillus alba]